MQGSFVTHHNEQHPDSCFKCEFCDTYHETRNGLFKHQCSHLYMKYKCKDCDKFFQFPYQFRNHLTQHTGVGKHLCSICAKSFGSKCSKDFHEKIHNVKIKYDLCPMSTSKFSTARLHCTYINVGCMAQVGHHCVAKTTSGNHSTLVAIKQTAKSALKRRRI